MLSPFVEQEIHQQLEVLPASQQRQVLDFARALAAARPRGVLGQSLLPLAGTIDAPDLVVISQAVKEDCGQIDSEGW